MIKFDGDMSIVIKHAADFFIEYKRKAVFNTVLTAKPVIYGSNTTSRTIEFYDGRVDPPFKVGSMWWDGDSYVVESPRIRNEKYARWNSQFHTKSTSDIKRAVKNALSFIKPFDWSMVAGEYVSDIRSELNNWTDSPNDKIREAIQLKVTRADLYNEIETALKEGRDFASANLNAAKQVMRDNLEEATRRTGLKLQALFVTIDEHGRYVSDKWVTPKQESEMPEDLLTKIGLLKMMDLANDSNKTDTIPEVGKRIGKNVFWLFIHDDLYMSLISREA